MRTMRSACLYAVMAAGLAQEHEPAPRETPTVRQDGQDTQSTPQGPAASPLAPPVTTESRDWPIVVYGAAALVGVVILLILRKSAR